MAMIHNVTVLTPNGRRQIVNVTPNSTILQVLEEVCKKHAFDPLEYDIRHHTRILDATMTVQFSRLPNNAQLEMVKAKKIRKESEVLVNIQIESGSRFSGSFPPSSSLWSVVVDLCQDSCDDSKVPAILYMRQEIVGIENLKETNLRDLGLTSGRALLRFSCKAAAGEVPKQTGVTSKLANFGVISASVERDSPTSDVSQFVNKKNEKQEKSSGSGAVKKNNESIVVTKNPVGQKLQTSVKKNNEVKIAEKMERPNKSNVVKHSVEDRVALSKKPCSDSHPVHSGEKRKDANVTIGENIELSSVDNFETDIEPRDRNAVVFKQGSYPTRAGEDLPEDFFDLTLDDVHNVYRDLKKKRLEMDETPLQTSAIKKLEESKRILNVLHKYKRAVLRIQFPDQLILQGSFSPVETVQSVHDFVRGYLNDPSVCFYLYTAPPKEILNLSSRLIEVNCVPCALLHFGVSGGIPGNIQYLRSEVLSNLSSPEEALDAANKSRKLPATGVVHSEPTSANEEGQASTSGMQTLKSAKKSDPPLESEVCKESKESGNSSSNHRDVKHGGNPNGKVPKWFKLGPK